MKCTGLKAVSYPDTRDLIKGNTVQTRTNTRIFYIVCYGELINMIMPLFRNFRERVKLLEYENEILARKIQALEKHIKYQAPPQFPFPRIIREDGWDLSYDTLRKRHRKHDVKFDDGL